MNYLILVASGATLIGFFAGLVIAALTIKLNNKKDDCRYKQMMNHNKAVESRLSRYSDHAERTADALESIARLIETKSR